MHNSTDSILYEDMQGEIEHLRMEKQSAQMTLSASVMEVAALKEQLLTCRDEVKRRAMD
jgi:hypothetical protein